MGERYWVTGVQLGLLQVLRTEEKRKQVIEEIIEKQFLGSNVPSSAAEGKR